MKVKKENYEVPVIEFIEFELEEGIATSGVGNDEDIFGFDNNPWG
jgi:hypothetical protein